MVKRNFQKLIGKQNRLSNNSGIILIIVLWILTILTVLAVSLGRQTNIEIKLAKHMIYKVKSKYMAWAGFHLALDQIRLDTEDKDSNKIDTLYYCGILMDSEKSNEEIFKDIDLGDGRFSVYYQPVVNEGEVVNTYFGLQDEERRLNLNAINEDNVNILVYLITELGFDEEIARTIAYSVIDWKDSNDSLVHESYGAEDDYYSAQAQPIFTKNLNLDSINELLLIRGITQDIYDQLKHYVTVYGESEGLKVNFNTALRQVLMAMAKHASERSPTAEYSDAESLVNKILDYRRGEDGFAFTEDDRGLDNDFTGLLISSEESIYLNMARYRGNRSDYLRIFVRGEGNNSRVVTQIEAVVSRAELTVMQFNRK